MEKDWKKFCAMVPDLRERYLAKENQKFIEILQAPDKSPTERFWNAYEQMKETRKILVTCFDGHSRSKLSDFIGLMYGYGILTDKDLEAFSDEVLVGVELVKSIRNMDETQ